MNNGRKISAGGTLLMEEELNALSIASVVAAKEQRNNRPIFEKILAGRKPKRLNDSIIFSCEVMNKRLNGQADTYVILVDISGFTRMVYNTDHATGKNITLRLLSSLIRNNRLGLSIAVKEGEFFSEFVSFFKQAPSLENFVALEDTGIAIVNAATLQKLIDQYPVFDRFVRLVYQETIVTIKEDMLHKIRLNAQDRYLYLMKTRPDIVRRVPLKHIASYIDITESTLSRIRRKIMQKE